MWLDSHLNLCIDKIIISFLFSVSYFKQPITIQDGKIGVNFGGYHAEAGLGGLLTGNAAHGGLTASAGTPFGQTAHAGLGGNTGRKYWHLFWWFSTISKKLKTFFLVFCLIPLANSRGGLFAGASAGDGVGASASLAGDVNNGGSFGVGDAEAHAGGISKGVIKTVSTNVEMNVIGTTVNVEAPVVVDESQPQSVPTATQSISVSIQSTTPIVQTQTIEQSEQTTQTIKTFQTTIQTTSTSAPETMVNSPPWLHFILFPFELICVLT